MRRLNQINRKVTAEKNKRLRDALAASRALLEPTKLALSEAIAAWNKLNAQRCGGEFKIEEEQLHGHNFVQLNLKIMLAGDKPFTLAVIRADEAGSLSMKPHFCIDWLPTTQEVLVATIQNFSQPKP